MQANLQTTALDILHDCGSCAPVSCNLSSLVTFGNWFKSLCGANDLLPSPLEGEGLGVRVNDVLAIVELMC